MSWDVHIQDFGDFARLEDIPDDFQPQPLGSRADVIAAIHKVLPSCDFNDPSWGIYSHRDGSIEIVFGQDTTCAGISLFVRGRDSIVDAVATIVEALPGRAVDMQTGSFFEPSTARASLGQFNEALAKVLATQDSPQPARRSWLSRVLGRKQS